MSGSACVPDLKQNVGQTILSPWRGDKIAKGTIPSFCPLGKGDKKETKKRQKFCPLAKGTKSSVLHSVLGLARRLTHSLRVHVMCTRCQEEFKKTFKASKIAQNALSKRKLSRFRVVFLILFMLLTNHKTTINHGGSKQLETPLLQQCHEERPSISKV